MSNENKEDDNITVSKVYETLKSGPFLRKLYWDVLSDIKEKDTFKEMKKTTEKLLNKKYEDLSNLSVSESDNLKRKTIVAEICSMTYAIDTVYSKILFTKLQNEFKTHIIDAIKELRQEKKIPDSIWSKLQISDDPEAKGPTENSTAKSNSLQHKPETSSRPVRRKCQKVTPTELATKNREIRSEIHEDLKAINSEDGKVDAPRKNLKAKNQAVRKKQTSPAVKYMSKKSPAEEKQTPSKSNTLTKNGEDKVILPEDDIHFENLGSDAESEISVGHVSLASVSSVHTSDLSSFDDEISLSSEDGENGTKRKMSLKELTEMCSDGRFSNKFNGSILKNLSEKSYKKNAGTTSEQQNESSPDSADNAPDSADSSTEANSPSQKTFPKRIRKPNSKYSSDNILCTIKKVKERKKHPVEVRNYIENNNNVKDSNDVKNSNDATQLSRKRTRSDASNSDGEASSKLKRIIVKEEHEVEVDLGNPSTQRISSELYKPHFAVRSLTSRKTAPVTLYST